MSQQERERDRAINAFLLTWGFFWAGMAVLLLLVSSLSCAGPRLSPVLTAVSRHEDRSAGYEEFNPGLSLEARWPAIPALGLEPALGTGVYRNSYGDASPHAVAGLWRGLPGPFEIGALAGAAWYPSGTEHDLLPLGAGALGLADGYRIRPRVLFIPDAGDGHIWVLQFAF